VRLQRLPRSSAAWPGVRFANRRKEQSALIAMTEQESKERRVGKYEGLVSDRKRADRNYRFTMGKSDNELHRGRIAKIREIRF
jgi:hypothetical protein